MRCAPISLKLNVSPLKCHGFEVSMKRQFFGDLPCGSSEYYQF